MAEAYIVAAVRTAGGRRNGRLSGWHPADLAGSVLDALIARTGCDPALVEDVILGCVGQAGQQATNIARNAVLASGLPESVPATSVDRQCGSSQQALHFAAQAVKAGSMDIVIAAGVESMTRVPMGLPSTLAAKAGMTVIGGDPVMMLEAPIPATLRALNKAGMTLNDIDLFDVNEAFASVPVAWLQATGADPARLNVNGGAIALGHPLGGSGAKLMTTLVHALKARGKRYGLQTMCEGGGMANVTIVERL